MIGSFVEILLKFNFIPQPGWVKNVPSIILFDFELLSIRTRKFLARLRLQSIKLYR